MKRLAILLFCLLALLSLSGCGGDSTFTRNSNIVIRLTRTDGTQRLLSGYELYMTRGGQTTLVDASSTTFAAPWTDNYSTTRSDSELQLSFTTRSDQPPYFLFVTVPDTGAGFETLRLQINVDGVDGRRVTKDLSVNTTQRLNGVRINRNSADY